MKWSPQQDSALKAVGEWFEKPDSKQVFRLFGYAGTGKTTLAIHLAEDVGTVCFAAFTGKAAMVMRSKGCEDACTIHSLIYNLDDQDKITGDAKFKLNYDSDVKRADMVIIDECSMVNEEMAHHLLSFGTKVLVLGDPAQLPPVSGTGFFTDCAADFMLTEVHRQARDNPIIDIATRIREGSQLVTGAYGDSQIITRKHITAADILTTDQVIVGRNNTRVNYNNRIRQLNQYDLKGPITSGEILVGLRNDHKRGLYNGGLYRVLKVRKKKKEFIGLAVTGVDYDAPVEVKVHEKILTGADHDLHWRDLIGSQQMTYGYALTCHKSQGSQWDDIVVFDEAAVFKENALRWRYTAVTRAAERLTLVV